MSNVKISAGDAAIAAARAGTTNKQTVKALWSIRGTLLARNVPGFDFPLPLVRSDVIRTLQALPEDDASGLAIQPGSHPAEWFLAPAGTAEPEKAKAKRKPGTRKAKPEPIAAESEPGTPAAE